MDELREIYDHYCVEPVLVLPTNNEIIQQYEVSTKAMVRFAIVERYMGDGELERLARNIDTYFTLIRLVPEQGLPSAMHLLQNVDKLCQIITNLAIEQERYEIAHNMSQLRKKINENY